MLIPIAIQWKYPNVDPTADFRVVDNGGNPLLTEWNRDEPIPTEEELQEWWIGYLKDDKTKKLRLACREQIIGGFIASLNGHKYGFDIEDQSNFTQQMVLLLSDPTINVIYWKTKDAGLITHTKDEFMSVIRDSEAHKRAAMQKVWALLDQLALATTEEEINNISWE